MSATRDEVLRAMANAAAQANARYEFGDNYEGFESSHAEAVPMLLEAALAAAEQAGWRLVPGTPSDAMKLKGKYAVAGHVESDHCDEEDCAHDVWTDMLKAAPKVV